MSHVCLNDSKGAQLEGSPELVQIIDPVVIAALSKVVSGKSAEDHVFRFQMCSYMKGIHCRHNKNTSTVVLKHL